MTRPSAIISSRPSRVRITRSATSPSRSRLSNAWVGAKSASTWIPVALSKAEDRLRIAPIRPSVESMRTVFSIDDSPLRSGAVHQLERRAEAQAALAGEGRCLQHRLLAVIAAGEADADLVAAEHRIVLGRRMLLVEDLAFPPAVRGRVAAEIIERGIAAEDAPAVDQHHAGQTAIDTIQHPHVHRVEAVGNPVLADAACDRRLV